MPDERGMQRRQFTTIPGVSDRGGLPRLGKVRLGMRSAEKGFPVELKHFLIDPSDALPESMQAALLAKIHERYGAEPVELSNVVFVSASRFEAFSENYEWWAGGRMRCHGDGTEAERIDLETGIWSPRADCVKSRHCGEWATGKHCKMIARLRFILPDVDVSGYWQLDTGSQYSAANIRDGINMLGVVFGRIHGIPVTLRRVPARIEYKGKTSVHHIVHLFPPSLTLAEAQAQHGSPRLLAAPESGEDLRANLERLAADAKREFSAFTSGRGSDALEVAAPSLAIPESDAPDELVEASAELEGDDPAAEPVTSAALRVIRYKREGAAGFTFRTSDNVDHRTRSASVFESIKAAKLRDAAVTLHEELVGEFGAEVLHVEVHYA